MDDEKMLELFRASVDDGSGRAAGSPSMHCSCGRLHFGNQDPEFESAVTVADEAPDMREKEYRELVEKAKAHPDYYIFHENDRGVIGFRINGLDYVMECPCKWETRILRFIVNEQALIVQFLARVIAEQNAVNRVEDAIGRLIAEKNFNPQIPVLTPDQVRKPYKGS